MHTILGRHIVSANWLGKYRPSHMFVTTKDGRIEYVAAQPGEVPGEMGKLFTDLERLLDEPLTIAEAFFFASMLHLVFVKIHPWVDGNGRSARLLEKWFLSQHLGRMPGSSNRSICIIAGMTLITRIYGSRDWNIRNWTTSKPCPS